jgi:hypothetical protein
MKSNNQRGTVDTTTDAVAAGTGGVAGAAAGAAIGSMAGPIGTIIGGLAGAVGGWWSGRAVSEAATSYSTDDDAYYQQHYMNTSRSAGSSSSASNNSYDSARPAYQLGHLAGQHELLLLGGHALPAGLLACLELLEPLQPLEHGLEVGQHAAEPTLVDVGHADAGRLLGDRLLGLLLGPDEEHRAAVGDGLLDELVRLVDVGQGLVQVDDVEPVALGQDEALHLRVPSTGLVPEVDARLEHFLHGDDGHAGRPPCMFVHTGALLAQHRVARGLGFCGPVG